MNLSQSGSITGQRVGDPLENSNILKIPHFQKIMVSN